MDGPQPFKTALKYTINRQQEARRTKYFYLGSRDSTLYKQMRSRSTTICAFAYS